MVAVRMSGDNIIKRIVSAGINIVGYPVRIFLSAASISIVFVFGSSMKMLSPCPTSIKCTFISSLSRLFTLSFSWVTLCVSLYDEPSADTSDEKPDEDEAFSDEKPDEDEAFSDETGAFTEQPESIARANAIAVIFFLKISLLTLYILAHR